MTGTNGVSGIIIQPKLNDNSAKLQEIMNKVKSGKLNSTDVVDIQSVIGIASQQQLIDIRNYIANNRGSFDGVDVNALLDDLDTAIMKKEASKTGGSNQSLFTSDTVILSNSVSSSNIDDNKSALDLVSAKNSAITKAGIAEVLDKKLIDQYIKIQNIC